MSHLKDFDEILSEEEALAACRRREEEYEKLTFHPKASFSKELKRRETEADFLSSSYKLDVERILHSKAYARYADKTQVVYLVENDHITHRSLHVQLVSCFARPDRIRFAAKPESG